jgi:hypothetical protein
MASSQGSPHAAEYLVELEVHDPLRSGFYRDLASRYVVSKQNNSSLRLEAVASDVQDSPTIDLARRRLTSLGGCASMCGADEVVLDGNDLASCLGYVSCTVC